MKFKMALNGNAVLIIGFIVLLATTITFLILYIGQLSNRVNPTQCPKISGNYGVTPNVAATDIKPQYLCTTSPDGDLGANLCSFTGITSLYQAQATCDLYTSDVCGGFFYNLPNGSVTFLSSGFSYTSQTATSTSNGDVYIRQN